MNARSNNTINSVRDIYMRPLTNDQIRAAAPSVFATEPWHTVSERYAFIPTIQVVDKMRAEGFEPVAVTQSRSRVEGKADFTRHMIRFRDVRQGDDALTLRLGQLFSELMLTNAHDGTALYKLDAALFRLACLNGMVVDDQTIQPVKVRHTGNPGDVVNATFTIVEQFPKMLESIERFQQLRLSPPEQEAFGTAALALRYDDAAAAPITARQAVASHRSEDDDATLWNTLNATQENLTQGGLPGRSESGRRQRTRPVTGIAENTKLNKALWTLAEEMRKLRN